MAIKTCSVCKIEKDISDFGKEGKSKDGVRSDCKLCRKTYMQEYRSRDHARKNSISSVRKCRYGMTEQDYQNMFDAQGGACAICRQPETCKNVGGTIKNLSVDHDHNCCPGEKSSCGNCIRGLLCANCNRGIGYLKDDENILLDAVTYLLSHKDVLVSGGDYHSNN